jgi:ABC-type transport system substrate-binding protein
MRLPGWAWLALSSLLISPLAGATRPRYGGTLAVDLSTSWTTLDPPDQPNDVTARGKREALSPLIVETLVRLNAKGEAEPLLAVAWQRDADRKRWRFSLRPKTAFHDGEPLHAANVAPSLLAALKKRYGDVSVTAGGQTIVVQSDHAMPDLLTELSRPRSAIFRKSDKNPLIGTGTFRVTAWEPGRRLTLAAFQDYWGGRPFLDSVAINMGVTRASGDVFDLPAGPGRHILPERTRIWSSAPQELIALLAVNTSPVVQQALALSIDRVPIVNVLAQRKGEATFGLLPQWLSGHAFLFTTAPDVARAKAIIGQQRLPTLTLSYTATDSFARAVAERVALNARDAGIIIQPGPGTNGNLRMVRLPLESTDSVAELVGFAAVLGMPERANQLNASKPETLYEAERALLEDHRMIPILYLPEVYGIAPRVHNWDAAQKNRTPVLHLEDVWVSP